MAESLFETIANDSFHSGIFDANGKHIAINDTVYYNVDSKFYIVMEYDKEQKTVYIAELNPKYGKTFKYRGKNVGVALTLKADSRGYIKNLEIRGSRYSRPLSDEVSTNPSGKK